MFKRQNFCHVASNNRNQVKVGVFVYRTTDDLETVSANGYFNDSIIDINLHDLIIHEKVDASDATKVQRNVLCVTERTLENVGTVVIKSQWQVDVEEDIADLQQELADLQHYVDETFVRIDGTSIMTGPLKMASGSMRGAFSPYLNGVGFFKMDSQYNLTQIATLSDTQFLPATTGAISLGSSAKRFKDLYLGGTNSTVDMDGTTFWLKGFFNLRNSNQTNSLCWHSGSTSDRYAWGLNSDINNVGFQYDSNLRSFMPLVDKSENLGSASFMWKNVYTPKLNNGADISVPTTSGTLALTSDIKDATITIKAGDTTAGTFTLNQNTNQNITIPANVASWSSNVSNCITEIPQDIKLELNNGTLTFKAGSKVYVPNGSGVFDIRNITTDKTTSSSGAGDGQYLMLCQSDGAITTAYTNVSGSTAPATPTNGMVWYDTANNLVRRYWGGNWNSGYSLPIALVSVSNGTFASIDQVFNGFGYIGSSIYALPGVKLAIPNGFNSDGTLKSDIRTNSSLIVKTYIVGTITDKSIIRMQYLDGSFILDDDYEDNIYYDEKTNTNIARNLGTKINCVIIDDNFLMDGNKVKSFVPRQVFNAVNYPDVKTTFVTENQKQITNCITEIPQDINISFVSGTLTIATGTKGTKPDGTKITTTADITRTSIGAASTDVFLFISSATNIEAVEIGRCYSGSTAPTVSGSATWLDTANMLIKRTTDSGATWTTVNWSLPICIVSRSSGTITSLDQVFNGFGYIGSTVFALPGVRMLVPESRYPDGTMKNYTYTIKNVLTKTESGTQDSLLVVDWDNDTLNISPTTGSLAYTYNFEENHFYLNGSPKRVCVVGNFTETSGVISNFSVKKVFRAFDYNDLQGFVLDSIDTEKSTVVSWNMPDYSSLVDNISNPYTPTVNGYIIARRTGTYGSIWVKNNTDDVQIAGISCTDSDSSTQIVMVIANKGVEYSFSPSNATAKFVPCKGA